MKTAFRIAAASLLLGLGALGTWACSDDDGNELTMEEYFQQLDEIDNNTDAQITANFESITDEDDVDAFRDATKEIAPILDQAAEDISSIDPPDAAKEEHDALVQELEDWADAATEAANSDEAAAATTPDELFTAFSEAGFDTAQQEFSDACSDLQQIAADN